jgi:hypothetical protein
MGHSFFEVEPSNTVEFAQAPPKPTYEELEAALEGAHTSMDILGQLLAMAWYDLNAIKAMEPAHIPNPTKDLGDLRTHVWNFQYRAEHIIKAIEEKVDFKSLGGQHE